MSALGQLWSSVWVRIALAVLAVVLVISIFGPALAPYDPLAQDTANALQGPTAVHVLGTDYLGRDVLSRLLAGAPVSLWSAVFAVVIGMLLGVVPGVLSAFSARPLEWLSLRVTDALIALPFIVFAIAFAGLLGNGLWQAMLAIGILFAPGLFRVSRAATLQITGSQYIESAQLQGASAFWIARVHVLRRIAPTIAVTAVGAIGSALLVVASLTFLGIGVQPPAPTWGGMLSSDLQYLAQKPFGPVAPALMIIVTVAALNLLADSARDVLGTAAAPERVRRGTAHVAVS